MRRRWPYSTPNQESGFARSAGAKSSAPPRRTGWLSRHWLEADFASASWPLCTMLLQLGGATYSVPRARQRTKPSTRMQDAHWLLEDVLSSPPEGGAVTVRLQLSDRARPTARRT